MSSVYTNTIKIIYSFNDNRVLRSSWNVYVSRFAVLFFHEILTINVFQMIFYAQRQHSKGVTNFSN